MCLFTHLLGVRRLCGSVLRLLVACAVGVLLVVLGAAMVAAPCFAFKG